MAHWARKCQRPTCGRFSGSAKITFVAPKYSYGAPRGTTWRPHEPARLTVRTTDENPVPSTRSQTMARPEPAKTGCTACGGRTVPSTLDEKAPAATTTRG